MANAKKCDRCGRFYEKRSIDCKTINSNFVKNLEGNLLMYEVNSSSGFYFDLCPICFRELMDFLNLEEVDEEEGERE